MALILHTSSGFPTKKLYHLLHKPSHANLTSLSIKSQDSSSKSSKPSTISSKSTDDTSPTAAPPSSKTLNSPAQGFGPSSSSNPATSKKKQKGKRERASIIRREPIEKPGFVSKQEEAQAKEMSRNESAFVLAWLSLGAIILVEGIVLAASGFLPEEWDNFFVKYLYPSFTPTVFLFVAGTVAYGLLTYLHNEKLNNKE